MTPETYNPKPKTAEWLDWLYDRIQLAPYEVTARWAFYRLVEEYDFVKSDYHKFLVTTSKARKRYYSKYNPTTFVDDTRTMSNEYGNGFESVTDWFNSQANKRPKLAFEHKQEYIVFVCFEAKAMIRQFAHYLDKYRVCLVPFGGDPSIPFKYKLATEIEEVADKYDKPVKVLYFGDYDEKGMQIPENAMKDVRAWSGVDFEFIRIGINDEHVKDLGISEDPEHPGKFQWEALDEKAAEKLINKVFNHWDREVVDNTITNEDRASNIWSGAVGDAIEEAKEQLDDEGGSDDSTEKS